MTSCLMSSRKVPLALIRPARPGRFVARDSCGRAWPSVSRPLEFLPDSEFCLESRLCLLRCGFWLRAVLLERRFARCIDLDRGLLLSGSVDGSRGIGE